MQRILNILSIYYQAGKGEIEAGLRWYLIAHDEAVRLGTLDGLRELGPDAADIASAIIAAVSPGLRWERNIAVAERIILGQSLDGLGVRWYDGIRKAERILDGDWPVLRGNKVTSFYDNIANPETSNAVCIDGHAYAIWAGDRMNLDDTPSISDNLYERISQDYREAARLSGIRPLQMQAITWTAWRRIHGVNSAHFLPLFE